MCYITGILQQSIVSQLHDLIEIFIDRYPYYSFLPCILSFEENFT